ncbi:nitroreductase family deazaflavin-dependent oxidoreductase [Sanguibacter antarcticus]|uniref:Deazaflavin-dependent oxidoreductase (Nitroreductase family) n=1 Tax=Sanguibacter antarcticus TaxID=372484 RepID=A0A2A9E8A2_9MICO|nr:nitroreductase family deazaflavin-dependent oxidoreductase [Sanguibacter antarcticus]PFG35178.1 deazaflavin-dependent oxidoreductase (nitroreductase family) [Sanguibacter antarcticus]
MPKPPASTSRAWIFLRQIAHLNTAVFRATRGKVGGKLMGAPVLLLHHVGRRSGQARTSPLLYLDDAPRLVIVASKGGVDDHPAWFHNLMAMVSTEVELPGGERRTVVPRVAEGDERTALWERLVVLYPTYATYATFTKRLIPVVVLDPVDA